MVPEMKAIWTTYGWVNIAADKWQEIMRKALAACAFKWHQEIMPGHFDRSAHRKYGYQSRDQKYISKKFKRQRSGNKRAIGDPSDLVFSGTSRMMAQLWPKLKAKENRVTVVLPGLPKYFYYTPVIGKHQPPKLLELGKLIPEEAEVLASLYAIEVERMMNEDKSVVFHGQGAGEAQEGPWSPTEWQAA